MGRLRHINVFGFSAEYLAKIAQGLVSFTEELGSFGGSSSPRNCQVPIRGFEKGLADRGGHHKEILPIPWIQADYFFRRPFSYWATPPVRLGLAGRNSGKIPERPRKCSQSVSWDSRREYGWDAPSPIIQGI